MRRSLRSLWTSETGASSVEFILVLPLAMLMTIGTIYLTMMLYATSCLHYAVEEGARCRAIKTATCTNDTTTNSYAAARYKGPGIGASFSTATTKAACGGYPVTGTGTYSLKTGLRTVSVPISATACYPSG